MLRELIAKFTYLKDGKLLGKQMSSPGQYIWGRNTLLTTILWLAYQSFMREDGLQWRKALNQSDRVHNSCSQGAHRPFSRPLFHKAQKPLAFAPPFVGTTRMERKVENYGQPRAPGLPGSWFLMLRASQTQFTWDINIMTGKLHDTWDFPMAFPTQLPVPHYGWFDTEESERGFRDNSWCLTRTGEPMEVQTFKNNFSAKLTCLHWACLYENQSFLQG